ncbi:hypothetical protein I8752_36560 [Nostocaceae cyanobacterium CENA369]|uniref:Uncharacterized protein n=1 Tax=Dendronalium phyllosphericum CENA369 TaxID=1725256 RepID=A0A8J7LLG9_9NOST|nr:hypothetical protein [Dendronalium phyllosphericum]MBH8578359.1 hypothetical protein [Dendronalium phyllosphericum CENA369]
MKRENQNGRKTKVREKRKNGKLDSIPRSVGTLSPKGAKTRDDSLGASRTNSDKSNTLVVSAGEGTPGGIARQLIDKTKEQLAYHKTQVSELEARIQELEQFAEDLETEETEKSTEEIEEVE